MNQDSSQKNKLVIAIYGSPSRNRNSDSMMDSFLSGVSSLKNVIVKKIYLSDIPIEMYSYNNRRGPTNNENAFRELTDDIVHADGLVISTPTYNFSVPGHLKNFIDRIRFIALDLEKKDLLGQPKGLLKNLSTYFLVSGGTPVWAEKILFFAFPAFWLRGVFLYFGAKVFGAYYSGDIRTVENKKILNKCYRKGQRYSERLVAEKGNRILERIFWKPIQRD